MSSNLSALKLQVLSRISTLIHRALYLEETLQEVLSILSESLSMERATVTLLDREGGYLRIMASHGLGPEEKQKGVYNTTEGATGKIFRTGKALHIPDVTRDPLFLDKTGSRRKTGQTVAYTGVPIVQNSSPIGVFSVDRLFSRDVSVQEDIEFLNVVATLIAQLVSLNESIREREDALRRENVSLKYKLNKESQGMYIVGKSPSTQEVENRIAKVAPTHANVLLLGESGTGKTHIARIIHELSEKKSGPFVKVHCASIPENLLESELFGYEKGAFTGANTSRPGKFENADGGTIFLDEIGELGPRVQAKLLRVLQEFEFERLGSNRTIRVNVRVLAATNRDLQEAIQEGSFRQDLYYRLNVFPITALPLRKRKEDVPGLLNHFLRRFAKEYNRNFYFTPKALHRLQSHDWPGNVRELENFVERAIIMAESEKIGASLVEQALNLDYTPDMPDKREQAPEVASLEQKDGQEGDTDSLQEMEKNKILAALRETGGVKRHAAVRLGITERQIGYRIRKYGLEDYIHKN